MAAALSAENSETCSRGCEVRPTAACYATVLLLMKVSTSSVASHRWRILHADIATTLCAGFCIGAVIHVSLHLRKGARLCLSQPAMPRCKLQSGGCIGCVMHILLFGRPSRDLAFSLQGLGMLSTDEQRYHDMCCPSGDCSLQLPTGRLGSLA